MRSAAASGSFQEGLGDRRSQGARRGGEVVRRRRLPAALAAVCEEAIRKIDLHWHDIRHECASRLVERGVPLAQVRDLLGHASITHHGRYDSQTLENLQASAAKLEAGKVFAPAPQGWSAGTAQA
ncbi:MAG: tyrosine-type recombinase/integrase [Desulfobacterales bacterium]|nr:tyrosine-type recombinase/integrase [Desulfobacterales bacterium]